MSFHRRYLAKWQPYKSVNLAKMKLCFYFLRSAKCTELPEAPQNGMVVAPKLDHGMVGKFECRDGYMLKGHNTTQCFFGNWTGMTPWCKEGMSAAKTLLVMTFTEKATGELKARIRASLYSAYLKHSEKGELELAKRYKECWLAGDQLQIQTLHGFCQQVSKEFAFENQCAMEMELVDDSKIYKAVFHDFFSRELPQTFGE